MIITPLTPVQRFWRLLRPDRDEIRNVLIYAFFAGLVNLSLPLGIQAIINLIQGGRVNSAWMVLVGVVVAGIGAVGVLQIRQMRITENLQQRIFTRAALEFAYRLPRIKTEVLYNHYAPELTNRFFDVLTVQKGLSKILIDFPVASLQVVFGLLLLSLYHPFFIVFGLILILLVAFIFVLTARQGLESSLKESKYKYSTVHWLEELARTAATFKLAGKSEMTLQRTDRHVLSYLDAREGHFKVLLRQYSMLVVFKVIVALGLLAIGGLLVMQELMNIGQFVAAEIIILFIMSSVEKLVLTLETVYDILTGLEKIGQVTDLALDRKQDGSTIIMSDSEEGLSVQLTDVTFRYPGSEKNVLSGVSLKVEQGERIMLTGETGSGKSTLLYIMAGLYDIQTGSVSYNDLPKNNLGLEELHGTIGDCLTMGELFNGTILENITMGRERATFENVQWAVENLGLTPVIRNLSHGYETHLDPTGDKLPRSVAQRLLLARAIADRPRLLLLENVFAVMNVEDRHHIIDFLLDPKHPWTVVAISNSDYFSQRCDRIVEMYDGQLIDSIPEG